MNGTDRPAAGRWSAAGVTLGAAAGYGAVTMVAFWDALARGLTHTMPCGCFDQAQSAWFLAWVPYALQHGHNPFFTTWLNPPHGVNLMDNASMPLLGLVMAPFTVLLGPVASWDILAMVAMAGSALAAFCVFRRFVAWRPAAFAGGLLYGFGPYMAAQGTTHLNLSFAVFPPVVLWLAEAVLVRQQGRAERWGVVFGACCLAQLLISTELLLTTATMAAIGAVALVATRWRSVLRALRGDTAVRTAAVRRMRWPPAERVGTHLVERAFEQSSTRPRGRTRSAFPVDPAGERLPYAGLFSTTSSRGP